MGSSNDIICSIADNWQLDAMQENMCKYFFTHNDLSLIQNGKKCYVIGRKGSGKSAICQYLVTDGQYDKFAQKLTFKTIVAPSVRTPHDCVPSTQTTYRTADPPKF